MSPRTKEQFEGIRNKSRQQILDAGLELFAKYGYHQTSVSQIAKKAKISKGLMYNYFKNKDDLLQTIIKNGIESLTPLLSEVNQNALPEKRLETIIRKSSLLIKEHTQFWNLYMSLFFQTEIQKKVGKLLGDLRNESVKMLADIFKQKGSKDPFIDAFILGIQLDGIGFNYIAAPNSFPIDEITEQLVKTYCKKENERKKR